MLPWSAIARQLPDLAVDHDRELIEQVIEAWTRPAPIEPQLSPQQFKFELYQYQLQLLAPDRSGGDGSL
jgi:hypothetical protein